jgi:hypothetical protein
MNKTKRIHLPKILALLPAAALLLTVFAGALANPKKAWSDDRDLLGTTGDKPYVFFIIDSSSSMRRFIGNEWVPGANDDPNSKIYQAKKAVYEVIDQVGENALFGFSIFDISTADPIDRHWLYTPESDPSWLSSVADFAGGSATRPWLGPGTANVAYPRPGHPLLFGDDSAQDEDDPAQIDGDHTDGSCEYPENLDVMVDSRAADDRNGNKTQWTDTRALGQMWSFAKLGREGNHDTIQWFKLNDKKYRITWKALAAGEEFGNVPLNVQVDLHQLNNDDCSDPAFDEIALNETLVLVPLYTEDLDGDEFTTSPTEIISQHSTSRGFFSAHDYRPGEACSEDTGRLYLETNYDIDDVGQQYSYDFVPDPLARDPDNNTLDRGDFIPLDWTNPGFVVGNRQEILRRLAPSILLGEEPDFRMARYFKSYDESVDGRLVLKDEFIDYPPVTTGANTPLGGSLFRFRQWYDDWVNVAIAQDPDWVCRGGVHIILLTDGNESCQGDYPPPDSTTAEFCLEGDTAPGGCGGSLTAACSCESNGNEIPAYQAYVLNKGLVNTLVTPDDPLTPEIETTFEDRPRDVKTYVIGYDNNQASLDYTARAGGTCSDRDGNPATPDECAYFPNNKDELVEDLLDILNNIRAEPRAFVPAATPPRTFNADEKIVLSNFVPIQGESTWDGHMGAFLKPLPLTSEGRPDTSVVCNGTTITESCFLWDVGEQLEAQAPTESEVNSTPPLLDIGPAAEERRVFYGQEPLFVDSVPLPRRPFAFDGGTTAAEWTDLLAGLGLDPTEVDRGKDVIRDTLKIKQATIPDPDDSTIDVEIQYVLGDIFHSDPAVVGIPNEGRFFGVDLFSTDPFDCTDNPGYRCYFEKHQFRRQVLAAGANDGQVHFFDLARFEYTTDPDEDGEYNNGTGRELFSYIPRGVLPNVLDQAESDNHGWDVDSPLRVSDVFIDPVHNGTPTADEREWRTVAMGGLRRGGQLYYALDMTQPDKLDTKNVGVPLNGYVPSCWNGGSAEDCGPVAYGTPLWEFTDTWDEDTAAQNGHGYGDLGNTWSVPNTGMIRVLEEIDGEDVEVIKFVAVFGGGMDPAKQGNQGNWLYMVDIETGKTIYKRRLSSSAASEPAAVDIDQNGFIDTIFIGTTDGYLYKADVSEPQLLDPTATVNEYSTGAELVRTVKRVTHAAWEPFEVFDTGGRPIYFPPSVIFVAKLGQYALAFGTGDREEILALNNQISRFYTFVDDGFSATDLRMPLDESDLTVIPFDSALEQTEDLLVNPPAGYEAGWAISLTANEKVITKALAFAGILTFSSFSPDASQTDQCGGTGAGKIFVVNSTNANPLHSLSGDATRFFDVSDVVTNPYVEPGGMPGDDDDDDDDSGNPCAGQLAMTQRLMQLFPSGCKFSNRTENIMTQRADTGVQCIAPVPICVDPKNWKEY